MAHIGFNPQKHKHASVHGKTFDTAKSLVEGANALQSAGACMMVLELPRLMILDEPVSALDVSVQLQILNLLQDLQEDLGLSYLFISHDLGVVERIADKVSVMYLGEVVETSTKENIFNNPLHPYTKALISAIPKTDPDEEKERILLKGELPSPTHPPTGCKFHPRCEFAMHICKESKPTSKEVEGNIVACHLYE